ncbi:MAG: BCAM0308 family protein [Methylophilus sp.]
MSINKTSSSTHASEFNRPLFKEDIDPYKSKVKLPDPTVCKQCGAVYHKGRWQWGEVPSNAHQETCPACRRINDNYPAGFITLKGTFFDIHCDEIKRLIHNHAEHERAEHPYKRIIAIEQNQEDTMLITTTDTHLARGIGEVVHNAYQGELKIDQSPDENLIRIYWTR